MNSEFSQENGKENKMLKDALYATIKLVLDQNKQIKKLKEAVTHRKFDNKKRNESSLTNNNDDSYAPDLSLLSLSKDGINPIATVNNFIKEHMPTNKNSSKSGISRMKSQSISHNDMQVEFEKDDKNQEDISINDVTLPSLTL